MEIIVLAILLLVPVMVISDPAPGALRTQATARNLDCAWLNSTTGRLQHPDVVAPPPPRGDYVNRQVLRCQQRLMRNGLRGSQDEAILQALRTLSTDFAGLATQQNPAWQSKNWHVEVFYPDPQVSNKIAMATKVALVEAGASVSDRVPVLSVEDIHVITRMPPDQAYPTACLRYGQTQALQPGDALLAVVLRDPRETQLHAGICSDGQWTWLR